MSVLRIYGDSFASIQPNDQNITSWPELLARKLQLPIVNNAIPGSSTENAVKNLCHDVENSVIKDNDIIVIVLSSSGRLNFQYQTEHPETAVEYLRDPINRPGHNHSWYWKNKNHIEWYIVNQDYQMLTINHTAYVSLIKDIANKLPACKFVILENTHFEFPNGLDYYPKNCIRSKISLNTVSNNEFDFPPGIDNPYQYWTQFTTFDARQNHLSKPNLVILSNLLFEAINNMNIDNISYDKFLQKHLKQIKNTSEYMYYVKQDFVDYNEWLFKFIKNKQD